MWIKLTTNQKQMGKFAGVYSESKLYNQRTHLPHRKIFFFYAHNSSAHHCQQDADLNVSSSTIGWIPTSLVIRFCTTSASPNQYNLQARGNKRAATKIKARDKTLSCIKNYKHKMNEKRTKQNQQCCTQKPHAQRYRQKGDMYTLLLHICSYLISFLY